MLRLVSASKPFATQAVLIFWGLGAGLLAIPWAGHFSQGSSPVVSGSLGRSELRAYLTRVKAGGAFDLDQATSQVFRGTEHSDERRIRLSENWLQWLAGRAHAPLLRTQNTDLLIDGGLANCSERSQILKTLAETAGRKCRFVGLNGHVVLEVHDRGGWRMADPDYGVAYDAGVEKLSHAKAAPVVREVLAGRGYPAAKIDRYLDILQSRSDNVVLPEGQPLSPRLYVVETTCQWLVWMLPALCLAAGVIAGSCGWPEAWRLARRSYRLGARFPKMGPRQQEAKRQRGLRAA